MSSLTHRPARSLLPEISDWFGTFPPLTGLRPLLDAHTIRVEDQLEEDRYVIRAELPGLDAKKDLDITVHDGLLTIKANREENTKHNGYSEFRYGSFVRTVSLPDTAKDDIQAEYTEGILTITVPLGESKRPAKQIKVK